MDWHEKSKKQKFNQINCWNSITREKTKKIADVDFGGQKNFNKLKIWFSEEKKTPRKKSYRKQQNEINENILKENTNKNEEEKNI